MNNGYMYLIEDELIERLKRNKKIVNDINIWHRFLPLTAIFPVVCFSLIFEVGAIVPSILWGAILGAIETYALYQNKKIKKEIKDLGIRICEIMELKDKTLEKYNSLDKKSYKGKKMSVQLDYSFENDKIEAKPFTKVRRRTERPSSRLRRDY